MNHSSFHELPPVDAYEDLSEAFSSHIDPPQDGAKPGTGKLSFAADTSPFWRINDASDWVERDLPKRQWIVPQYLMKRKVTAMIGAPEAGKSTMALKQGICLVLDVPFGDFIPVPLPGEAPRGRRVAILNAEDDEEEQQRRISSLVRETGRNVADLAGNLIRIGPGSSTAKLFEPAPDNGEVCTTQAFEDLKTYLKERKVDVLILDPLVELMGGLDENSNAIMGQVFAKLRGLAEDCDLALMVIHHTRKGVTTPGNLEAARGGSALGGSIRIGLTLTVMREDEATELGLPKDTRKHYVRLDNAKQSYGPPSDSAVWFHRYSVILDNGDSSPAIEPWSPPTPIALTMSDLAPIETAIKAGTPEGSPYSAKLSAEPRSIKHILVKHGFATRQAQEKVLDALRTSGMILDTYLRRDAAGHVKGRAQGMRIGSLPAVEWDDQKSPEHATPSGD